MSPGLPKTYKNAAFGPREIKRILSYFPCEHLLSLWSGVVLEKLKRRTRRRFLTILKGSRGYSLAFLSNVAKFSNGLPQSSLRFL